MSKYVIGIDMGTTGTKAMVIDQKGKGYGSAYREYPFITPKPDWVELDAQNMADQAYIVVREALEKSGVDKEEILAISFSSQRSTILLVDENGEALENRACVWLDIRANEILDEMQSKVDFTTLENRTGMPCNAIYGLEKYYWFKQKRPDLYEQSAYFTTVAGYMMKKFGTERFVDEVSTSQSSGMIGAETMDYIYDVYDVLGFDVKKLPPLAKPGEVVGHISEEVAAKTGLSTSTLIVAGAGDQQAGSLGAGVINSGDLSCTMGTAGFVIAAIEHPKFEKFQGLMVSTTPNLGVFEIEGIQNSGATCYRWARDTFFSTEAQIAKDTGIDEYDLMGKYVDQSKPGSNGLIFTAGLFGTGYPTWNSAATGNFIGLKSTHTRGDIFRAVMEGATMEAKFMLESMRETGAHLNDVCTITGGATKSPVWRQIMADVLGVKCRTLDVADAPVMGVAGLAFIGAGVYGTLQEVVENMVHFKDEVDPIPENKALYEKIFEIYKKIYYTLNDNGIYDMLNNLN